MPYGHAESNDLLRNREWSTRCARRYATEYSLFPSENGAYKVRPQVTHTAPPLGEREKLRNGVTIDNEIIRNASISQVMNYEISSFIELTLKQ